MNVERTIIKAVRFVPYVTRNVSKLVNLQTAQLNLSLAYVVHLGCRFVESGKNAS